MQGTCTKSKVYIYVPNIDQGQPKTDAKRTGTESIPNCQLLVGCAWTTGRAAQNGRIVINIPKIPSPAQNHWNNGITTGQPDNRTTSKSCGNNASCCCDRGVVLAKEGGWGGGGPIRPIPIPGTMWLSIDCAPGSVLCPWDLGTTCQEPAPFEQHNRMPPLLTLGASDGLISQHSGAQSQPLQKSRIVVVLVHRGAHCQAPSAPASCRRQTASQNRLDIEWGRLPTGC